MATNPTPTPTPRAITDQDSSPSILSSILDAAKREGSSAINSVTGMPSGIYHALTDPATPEETQAAGGPQEVSGAKRVGLGLQRLTTAPVAAAADWYKQVAQGKVPNAYEQALSVAPEAIGAGASGPLVDKLMSPIAAEHPAVANQALAEHEAYGGSTTNPRTGASMTGTKNWSVGVAPEATQISEKSFTPDEYSQFAKTHADTLAQHQNSAIGTSYDPTTGLHHMEVVATTPSKTAALNMASTLGEKNVFNLGTHETIPTGATGDRPLTHLSIDDRLQQVRDDSPTKAPFSGTHFTDAKLDTIDGARRGNSGVGAESARLRLGSQTGMGPDAPPGFHAYSNGSLPEAQIAGKKNAYSVRGQMAFGTTDHPLFQAGYQEGVQNALNNGADPQTAHLLGLNNAEHALQSAGFDGYHTPSNPSSRFVFGSHDTVPAGKYEPPQGNKLITVDPADDPNQFTSGGTRKLKIGHPDVSSDAAATKFQGFPTPDENTTAGGSRNLVMGGNREPAPDLGATARAASEKAFGPQRRSGDKTAPLNAAGEPNWPANYQPTSFADTDQGGANYSAADLEAIKKQLGIGKSAGK